MTRIRDRDEDRAAAREGATGARAVRFPIDPIESHLATSYGRPPSAGEVGEALGYERRTIVRYRTQGLNYSQADIAAVRLGLHPIDLWPDLWLDLPVTAPDRLLDRWVTDEQARRVAAMFGRHADSEGAAA